MIDLWLGLKALWEYFDIILCINFTYFLHSFNISKHIIPDMYLNIFQIMQINNKCLEDDGGKKMMRRMHISCSK